MEQRAIWSHSSTDPEYGYNRRRGGDSQGARSLSTRQKMSRGKKGRPLTAEHREKISKGTRGMKTHAWTPESRAKLSASKKGRSWTPEMREAILAGLLTPETKAKQADAARRYNATRVRNDKGQFVN